MEDTAKLKAPKKLKLTKPRPRKDANQNNVPETLLSGSNNFISNLSSHSDLFDENFDIRGDSCDTWSSSSESSSGISDYVNANFKVANSIIPNTVSLDRRNENCTLSRRNSEASSICSGSEDFNANIGIEVSKMRAPRKLKLNKPRPLKTSKSDENGNENNGNQSSKRSGENFTDVTSKISCFLEELKQGNLSVNECLELRDLLAVHCPHLEIINRDYIDTCFKHIEEVLNAKKIQDKLVLINLRDLVELRQRAWQPYPIPPSSRKKSITWNDIAKDIIYTDCLLNNEKLTNVPLVEQQTSVDSGIDIGEQVLWNTEESFEEDLSTEIWSKCQPDEIDIKERSPSPQSVIEAVKGLKIVGEDEEFVKAAAELLQKYLKTKRSTTKEEMIPLEANKNVHKQGKLMNNVSRQPIGPGTNKELVEEVEKTLPSGRNTAKGRRAMFRSYNSAISPCIEENTDHQTLASPSYTREEILFLAYSQFSRKCPPEMSYLSKVFPDICFNQTEQYFSQSDLSIGDVGSICPVVPMRKDRNSVSINRPFYKRGFSCPGNSDSNVERDGAGDSLEISSQSHGIGFGKPSLRRGFSCPSGDGYNKIERQEIKTVTGGFGSRSSVDWDRNTGFSGGFGKPSCEANSSQNSVCDRRN